VTLHDQYRAARNRIRRLGCRDSLSVTWVYALFLQIRNDFQFPVDIEVDRAFLALDVPQSWIAEWTLEQLAREAVMHGDVESRRGASLRSDRIYLTLNGPDRGGCSRGLRRSSVPNANGSEACAVPLL
jgi:hypothetical protein